MCTKMLTIWFWLWAFWLLFIVFFFCRLTDNWTMDASREKYWYGCGWGECLQLIQQNLMQFDTENFYLKDDFLRSWHACCSFWSCLQATLTLHTTSLLDEMSTLTKLESKICRLFFSREMSNVMTSLMQYLSCL